MSSKAHHESRRLHSTKEQREQWLRSHPKYQHLFQDGKLTREVAREEQKEIFRDMQKAGLLAPTTYFGDVWNLSVSIFKGTTTMETQTQTSVTSVIRRKLASQSSTSQSSTEAPNSLHRNKENSNDEELTEQQPVKFVN